MMRDPLLDYTQMGIMVWDLTDDQQLFSMNQRQLLRPASTMKLVTAITALDYLGTDYQFTTSLYYTGDITGRTLHGNLYCVGGMDPRFNTDDLMAFVESVRSLGIDTLRGRIVADRSFKEEELLGEGWCWDDDNPVLTPLLLNRKDNLTERLAERLTDSGAVVEAQLATGMLPAGATRICQRTHSIEQVLHKMMKESDNLYAEATFFQLAAAEGQRPAKAKNGANAVKKLIQKVGLAPSSYRIADGSGLSLYNYVSPELMTRLLRYAWRNKNISDCLLPTLAIAGVDGTLQGRMKKTKAEGNVHAKTGTLTGISSLAGYCTSPEGHELCFAIINQGVMRNGDGRDFQDEVCQLLCK
jgi:D-alanyl-D-alanine carboxypeptidase/D-alanyl-D-alanine-endopeptidase (penicillin-binding protein 4)